MQQKNAIQTLVRARGWVPSHRYFLQLQSFHELVANQQLEYIKTLDCVQCQGLQTVAFYNISACQLWYDLGKVRVSLLKHAVRIRER